VSPRVSLLIPTRNRVDLLADAVQAAVQQTYPALEIIVSNNASTDTTGDYLRSFSDPRLRHVECAELLPFHEHWRFLLGQATGDYVVFLCDDDAMLPATIARGVAALAATGLDLVCWNWAFLDNAKAELRYSWGSGQVLRLSGHGTAQQLLNGDFSRPKPQLNNCLIPRHDLSAMIERFPYGFSPFGGDFASAIYLLAQREEYAVVDSPLNVFTEWTGSLTHAALQLDHAAIDAYFAKAGGYPPIPVEMPLQRLNLIANRLFANCRAAAQLTTPIRPLEWDPTEYFLVAWLEIQSCYPNEVAYFDEVLRTFAADVQQRVRARRGDRAGFLLANAKPSWRVHKWINAVETALRPELKRVRQQVLAPCASAGEAARRSAEWAEPVGP
jgi:hypothetical protein